MNQEYLEFMASYLDKIDEAQNIDIERIGYDRYAENLFDIIIEISNVFEKELPEIKTSVLLRHDSLNRDIDITTGIIRKFLIKNGYKKARNLDSQINKFWTSFKVYFEKELPYKGYLKSEFVGYDNWNGGVYYLDISYDYQYKLHYGIEYKECSTINDIKMFIELAFSSWIENEKRYDFTKDVNAIFQKFRMPFKLQKGKVIKSGYRTTNLNEKIINYTMLERKIQYAEEMILINSSCYFIDILFLLEILFKTFYEIGKKYIKIRSF